MSAHAWRIGPHEVGFESGILSVCYHGPIRGPEMSEILALIDAMVARSGAICILIDSNDTPGPDVSARRAMSTHGFQDVTAMARFQRGVNPSSVFTLLVQNAARLLGRPTTRTAVFETEGEARAWLLQMRATEGRDLIQGAPSRAPSSSKAR
ncbi:MAG: STAS/SEC14 domain-containing protein [Polyangia bacterium]